MISFDSLAERELEDAARWYESRKPGLGLRFVVAVDRVVQRISTLPHSFPIVEVEGGGAPARRAKMTGFPYSIVFIEVDSREFRIIAVSHQRRRPSYWIDRLDPEG